MFNRYRHQSVCDYSPGDFDRDGDVDTTDQISFNAAKPVGGTGSGVPAKDPMADLDMDGDVDNADSTAFTTIKNAGGAVTEAFVSSIGNPFFFTGRRLYFLETLPEAGATAPKHTPHRAENLLRKAPSPRKLKTNDRNGIVVHH